MYGPHTPLMMYAADAAVARGARLRPISWSGVEQLDALDDPARVVRWVLDQVEPIIDDAPAEPAGTLLVAKSLGTNAAVLAADRGLPAVWLTPLLIWDPVVDALRRATAPFLLIGGTADKSWDSVLAPELTPHVLEVEGADHGMYVPGPLARSAAVLGEVATAVENFLDDVVWPDAGPRARSK
jgi:hypothetical protein